jgi:hypothetical protein
MIITIFSLTFYFILFIYNLRSNKLYPNKILSMGYTFLYLLTSITPLIFLCKCKGPNNFFLVSKILKHHYKYIYSFFLLPILGFTNCRRGISPAGRRNAPALNPKMRRGLSILPARWIREEHKNTQGFRVVRAAGA